MSYSNVYFDRRKSVINYWEYNNGVKEQKVAPAPLFFFTHATDEQQEDCDYRSIFGDKLKKHEFKTWRQFKEKREYFTDAGIPLYESDVPIETKFIIQHYDGINIQVPEFDIHYIDIEVHSEEGFPRPENADFPVKIITVWSTKKEEFFVWAEKDFDSSFLNTEKITKFIIDDESKLLTHYMNWTRKVHPDFLSGWNSNGFDIPYIMNRVENLLGEGEYNKISPINNVRSHEMTLKNGQMKKLFQIGGISTVDMLEVFQNYTFSQRASWKLDDVAEDYLGEKKLDYDGTLSELYNKDWQLYCEYNIQDVRLLRKLEEKTRFLNILTAFCYGCRVPFDFYQKTVRVLDGAFLSELYKENLVLPDVARLPKQKFPGGFVKEPIKGLHEWTVSFDATSLYPSIMMGWNISPETKIDKIKASYVDSIMSALSTGEVSDKIILTESDEEFTLEEIVNLIKNHNLALAGNGSLYTQDKVGLVPRFVKQWFDKRKYYKNLMTDAKKKGNKDDEQKFDSLQLNYKILINSVYGYLSTNYSRFYDIDNAMGVTLTGQTITKRVSETVENFFANKWSEHPLGKKRNVENFEGASIYCDTDSVYVDVGKILDSLKVKYRESIQEDEIDKVVNFINNKIEPLVSGTIEKAMIDLTTKEFNCKNNHIFFKRESVARRSFYLEKKKYIMWEVNGEGNVKSDKLKATGVDIVRSSTPPLAKKHMKDSLFELLKYVDKDKLINRLREVRKLFLNAKIHDIAFPTTANKLIEWREKYIEDGKFYKTPQHIKGSILYNEEIERKPELSTKYDLIYEGDKIKFVLMKPGVDWKHNILSFKDSWIEEFNIDRNIDRERQYERAFFNPLKKYITLLNWDVPDLTKHDISHMFDFI